MRRPGHIALKRRGLGQVKNMVSMRKRLACVEYVAVPGHWEGDDIIAEPNAVARRLNERPRKVPDYERR